MNSAVPMPRIAPHNIEAEQALLGAILINNGALDRVSGFLDAGHFHDPVHAQIFETISALVKSGRSADPISLKATFRNASAISDEMSVAQYLGRLAANATTIINAADYGRTIVDLATRRALITIGEDLVNAAFDAPVDFPPAQQIEEAETRLHGLVQHGANEKPTWTLQDALAGAIADANAAYQRGADLAGLSTGIAALDAKVGGMAPGDLIIIAGRPGMGKSALAATIALNCARPKLPSASSGEIPPPVPAAFYSMEMGAKQVAARILSTTANVPAWSMRTGRLQADDMRRMVASADSLAHVPLVFDETGALTIGQLAARARRLKRQKGIGLIVVDYLQLMRGAGRHGNRVGEITEITTGLKALAKELEVPVIALSQLNRQVESREDKRPQLSDLRESGSIEQDADIVMLVYREDYYVERQKPEEADPQAFRDWAARMRAANGKAEVVIAKHRHGPTGVVELSFDAKSTSFADAPDGGCT
jgi:replicative DNA helicase